MIRALAGRILRQHRMILVALSLGVFALELLIVHIAAAFGPTMIQMFEALPPIFRSFIGAQLEELSLTAFVGFGFQHPGTLAMGVSLVVLTATIPAAERETGLLDLLLAHPVSRARYLTAVVLVLGFECLLLPSCGLLGAWVGLATIEVPDEPVWTSFIPSALGLFTLLLTWGGIALWLSTLGRRRGTAAARAAGAVLFFFLLETLSSLYAPLESWSWMSPFHYFQPISSAVSKWEWRDPAILLGLFGIAAALAFANFRRRDL